MSVRGRNSEYREAIRLRRLLKSITDDYQWAKRVNLMPIEELRGTYAIMRDSRTSKQN